MIVAERVERGHPSTLVEVAVQSADREAVFFEAAIDHLHVALAIAEDDRVLEVLGAADDATQRRALLFRAAAGLDQFDCVMLRAFVEAGRETSMRIGFCKNCSVRRVISGGMVAEKNSVWRVNGTSLQMLLDVGNETHVEHPVGLVDHENLDAGQQDFAAIGEIEQAAREWR